MSQLFQPFLFLLARSTADDLQKQVEFLKAENELLRNRVPRKRIFLKADERARLVKLGKELGPAIRQMISIVDYSTFRRWIRKEEGKGLNRKGRPRLAAIVRELVVLIANETGWGYTRILGELKKLRVGPVSRQSVKNILLEHGLDPGPKRGKGTWSDFLRIHSETLWQCDFFSKRIWTLQGPRQIFALAFIHLTTRQVFVTPGTFQPGAAWMDRQARAFLDHVATEQLPCSIVTHDYDGKFSKAFDQVFKDRSIQIKPVGPQAPNLNAFIERWIQSLQVEALDHFIVFGQEHFDHIVSEFVAYYHRCRPHQGIGNRLIGSKGGDEAPQAVSLDQVRCEKRLGGLLKHYYRAA